MSWKFGEKARAGAETALDACDYFVDDVKDVWRKAGLCEKVMCVRRR